MLMRLRVFSHHVEVTQMDRRQQSAIIDFGKTLTEYEWIRDPNGMMRKEPIRSFYSTTSNHQEFRFHITQMQNLLGHLRIAGIDESQYVTEYVPFPVPYKATLEMMDHLVDRDYQTDILSFIKNEAYTTPGGGKIATISIQTGGGKCNSLRSAIKIPGGWTIMGDVKVGDIITAHDGTPTTVIATHPQGEKQTYLVMFSDKRGTEVGAEHLWEVFYFDVDASLDTRKIMNTIDLMVLLSIPDSKPSIRLIKSEPESHQERLDELAALLTTPLSDTKETFIGRTFSFDMAIRAEELVRSLGGICKVTHLEDLLEYEIEGHLPVDNSNVRLEVSDITPLRVTECQCITIDHPDHLYVTDDYIVTHNSHISMRHVELTGERAMYVMRAEYCDKWMLDFKNNYKLKKNSDDVLLVRGGKAFDKMIEKAKRGKLKAKIILVSNTTFRNFIKDYEYFNGNGVYDVKPWELTTLLGLGSVVTDEAHLDFHFMYKMSCYLHVKYLIQMSATIVPTNKFLKEMYFHLFPLASRYNRLAYKKYIEVKAYMYRLENPKNVKYRYKMRRTYSQNAYEEWIIKNPKVLKNYLEMIGTIVDADFIGVYQKGMSYVVFSSTVEMTNIIFDFLRKRYPQFYTYRYIGGDSYDEFLKADLVSSSLRKAGAAVDKPNLVGSLMTDAVDSQQTNEQALGRTREMKNFPEVTPRFSYLCCKDIPQHLMYHGSKVKFFNDKVKLHRALYTSDLV